MNVDSEICVWVDIFSFVLLLFLCVEIFFKLAIMKTFLLIFTIKVVIFDDAASIVTGKKIACMPAIQAVMQIHTLILHSLRHTQKEVAGFLQLLASKNSTWFPIFHRFLFSNPVQLDLLSLNFVQEIFSSWQIDSLHVSDDV